MSDEGQPIPPISEAEQLEWFTRHMVLIPERIRGLAFQRFRDNASVYEDRIFRKLLTPEGEAALLRDMDEEEADWWVYWLVSRVGYELAESHYVSDVTPSSELRALRQTRKPEGW
jgi:hypothetical protein